MRLKYITLRDEQHPLCYNLSAVEEICEEFGSLDAMREAVSDGSGQLTAIGKLLRCLLAGGRAYCQEMEIELPRPIRNPAALIDVTDPDTVRAIFSTINEDKKTTVEAQSKKEEATPGN